MSEKYIEDGKRLTKKGDTDMPVMTAEGLARLDVWLEPEQLKRFRRYCKKRHIGMSTLLRSKVQKLIKK